MDSVVITMAKRTPLGAFNGNFKGFSSVELGKAVVSYLVKDFPGKIDSLFMGCVLSAGLGQSPARQVAIGAGLDFSVNCANINKICGSGMKSIMIARNAILCGENEIAIAGGMESMTNAPYLLEKARSGYRFGDGKLVDHMVRDGLEDAYGKCVMGLYAEKTAEIYSFSRKEQDDFTLRSFTKARKAIEDGLSRNEIVPVVVKNKKSELIVDMDEIPFSVNLERIPSLKPAFKPDGTVTAASASSISDGAAAMILMKESKAKELKLSPIARIAAQSSYSQDPSLFTTAPVGAVKNIAEKTGWKLSDVDLFEINEAFAVVPMSAMKDLDIPEEKVNIFGGACALGHPLGASGARIVVTLINAMKKRNAHRGIATLCVGGGEGVALALEM